MALTSTICNALIDLSDVDRGVYETLDLRVAMHPSESAACLATRLLAYCLEYTSGIEFTGISRIFFPSSLPPAPRSIAPPIRCTAGTPACEEIAQVAVRGSKSGHRRRIGSIAPASWRSASPSRGPARSPPL